MLKIKYVILLSLIAISFLVGRSWQNSKTPVKAQGGVYPIGPELAISKAGDTVVYRQNYTGVVSVINYLRHGETQPFNPITDKTQNPSIYLRVDIDANTPDTEIINYALRLKEIGPSEFPNGIKAVILGVEMNNLDPEFWNEPGVSVETAARHYADKFIKFAAALDNAYPLAPAPPDLFMGNPNYNADPWMSAFTSYRNSYGNTCDWVDVNVSDIFELEPTVGGGRYSWLNIHQYQQEKMCGAPVVHFEGWGMEPGKNPDVSEQVAWYQSHELPSDVPTATTLIIPICDGKRQTGETWWYYIEGRVFKHDGTEVDVENCSSISHPPIPVNKDPFPPPYIACDQVYDNMDFHSLRPFQASPCNPEPAVSYAMCANDLIATEKIELTWAGALPTGISLKEDCEEIAGNMVCQFEVNEREIHVDVDLSTAELPIVGLTQGPYVNNSQYRPFGTLTDAQRMNEYLSWYMNGTVYRAEENRPVYYEEYPGKPEEISDEDYETLRQRAGEVINFSGPLNKMLPKDVQTKERLEEIERTEGGDINQDGENKKESDENGPRHNQIVGCLYKLEGYNSFFDAIATVGDFFNFLNNLGPVDYLVPDSFTKGKDVDANPPGPCYPELDENGDMEITSDELDELKVSFGSAIDWLTPDLKVKVETKRLTDWVGELPPLRENYENFSDYWMAYKEWRGDFCLSLGFVYWCFDPGGEDLLPKWPGELFYNIPYSSTEDRVGQISMQSAKTQPPSDLRNQTVSFVPDDEDGTNSKSLFFPHMQETAELGALIQSTYVTGIDTELKNKWLVDSNFIPQNTQSAGYNTNFCEPLESRNPNPGDDLFGDYPENPHLTGNIVYSGEFTCTFPRQETTGGSGADYTCSTPGAVACRLQPEPASDYCREFTCGDDGFWHESGGDACVSQGCEPIPSISYGNCTVELSTGLSLYTNTPNIEELWERYVNGEMSTFKRIYPKVGEGRPVTEIKDIPADTKISYSSNATETNAGDPNRSRPGTNASLYIPHLGSIYDYFLKGIQKALRPKDAGINLSTIGQSLAPAYNYFESIACPSSTAPPSNIDYREGVLCESTPDECNPNAPIPAGYDGVFKQNVIDLAKRWVETGGENSLVEYCYNTVVSKSLEAQVNPIYTLAIWIQESGASNYNSNITTCDPSRPSQTVQDFGINDPSIAGNFAAQLNRFLRLPYYYPNTYGQCFEDGCNLGTFSRVYQQGASETCSVNNSAISYADKTARTMSSIFNGCQPKYPTDLSCHP